MRIVIIDYGASNLRSVAKAFEKLGHAPLISSSPIDLNSADGVVLPGQGAATNAMEGLRERYLLEPLSKLIRDGLPFLGVCMGLQILFDFSEEGDQECFGILDGAVKRLPNRVKVPHIGWNQVVYENGNNPLFDKIPNNSYFYFVHSYYPAPEKSSITIAKTEYDFSFICSFKKCYPTYKLSHLNVKNKEVIKCQRH